MKQRGGGEQQQPGDQRGSRLGVEHVPELAEVERVGELAGPGVGRAQQQQHERGARSASTQPRDDQPLHGRTPAPRGQQHEDEGRAADQQDEPGVREVAGDAVERADDPPPASWSGSATVVSEGAPTEKVKAPETGWLSAETACQATV